MTFSVALDALKKGEKVSRHGWNGKRQFVYLVPASRYTAMTDAAKEFADEDGKVQYGAYFAIRTNYGIMNTWVLSVSDLVAEDWYIL